MVNLPPQCFVHQIDPDHYKDLHPKEAMRIILSGDTSYRFFTSTRKDFCTRPKNLTFYPTISKVHGQKLIEFVRDTDEKFRELHTSVMTKRRKRLLPPCGIGLTELMYVSPPDSPAVCTWSWPLEEEADEPTAGPSSAFPAVIM